MKKRLGFTLIELLAVIVILAVIAIIVTPMIMGTINSARSNALKTSAQGIIHAAEEYCARKQVGGEAFTSKSFAINETTAKEIGFSYNTELTGTLAISSNCKVSIAVANANYQATKTQDEDDITTASKAENFDELSKTLVMLTPESCFTTLDNGDGTLAINRYTCSATDIVIPGTIGGKHVTIIGSTQIASSAAKANSLSNASNDLDDLKMSPYIETNNLSLQKLVSSSGSTAYLHIASNLTSVDLSNMSYLVEIKDDAFDENLITSLNIGNLPELTKIGTNAFNGNYGHGGNMIDNLVLKDLPKLTTISDGAFSGNSLTTIELNNLPMLTTIGEYAFDGLTAKSIILKDLPVLTTIGSMAFSRDKWTTQTNGVSYSYNNCSPTYTFDNVPSVQAYDSTAKTGMSTLAFGQYPSACGASAAGDCKDEPAPVVNILNNVSSELKKSTIFDGVDTWECSQNVQ